MIDKKKEYKRTEIGTIPSEWEIKNICDIGEIITGSTPKITDDIDKEQHLWASPADMGNKKYIRDTVKKLNNSSFNKTRILPKGSILVTCIGSTIGKIGIADDELSTNQQINSIVCNDKYNNEYIYYVIGYNFNNYMRFISSQAVPIINKTIFSQFKIQIPCREEQEKIAEILSTWDSAIEKQEQLIEKKKEFKKGLMQVLYSKGTKKEKLVKSKLGEVPESWNIIKAKEVFKSVSIKNNQNEELLSVTQDKGTIPRSQLEGNVVMPEGSTNGYKLVVPNNFIISLRSFQGGLEISRHRGIISPAYTVLENKIDICHDYFKYYFKKEDFISRLNGAIVGIRDGKQISYADFGEMFLPVPPIEEQRKIAEILALADKEIELLQKELEALKLQKKGLMQRLLTGEVRVKV